MRRGITILLFWAWVSPAFAKPTVHKSAEEQLKAALLSFKVKRFVSAIRFAKPLLDTLKLSDLEPILLCHEILALSYCEVGQEAAAQKHTQALIDFGLKKTTGLAANPRCTSWLEHTLNPPQAQQKLVYRERFSLLKTFTPFGLSQWERGDKITGVSLLVSQTLGLAVGLSGYLLYRLEQNPDGSVPKKNQAETYRLMNWIGFSGAGLSYTLGSLHAYQRYYNRTP